MGAGQMYALVLETGEADLKDYTDCPQVLPTPVPDNAC